MVVNKGGLFFAGVMVVLCGCSSGDGESSDTIWSVCESPSTLECASLDVPLDYSESEGEKITLSLMRKPAPSATRQGALLFNPGGPGGSGIELIKLFEEIDSIPPAVLAAYDLVGFDPRGIGRSTAVDCSGLGLEDISDYPIGEQAIVELHRQLSQFSAACSAKEGQYLQHLGSKNVVRDMDEIRQFIGEDKLNFIGYSYGTRLAALYLQEFPQNSGRIVLDASVSPDSSLTELVRGSLPVLQSNLELVLSRCESTDPGCNVDQLIDRLISRVVSLSTDSAAVSAAEFEIFGEMVSIAAQEPEFGLFAADTIIKYLNSYDVTVLENFAELLESLGEDLDADNEDNETAQIAVLCADDAYRPDAQGLSDLFTDFNGLSDAFAESQLTLAALCSGWPQALEPLAPIASNTAPVSLVIGGTSDAQTPVQLSEEMARAIGGIFIRSEHLGHTSVFAEESDCIDQLVEQFLVDGLLPAVTACTE